MRTTSQNKVMDANLTDDDGDGTCPGEEPGCTFGLRSEASLEDDFWSEHFNTM